MAVRRYTSARRCNITLDTIEWVVDILMFTLRPDRPRGVSSETTPTGYDENDHRNARRRGQRPTVRTTETRYCDLYAEP